MQTPVELARPLEFRLCGLLRLNSPGQEGHWVGLYTVAADLLRVSVVQLFLSSCSEIHFII
jgi:hypothetical protein